MGLRIKSPTEKSLAYFNNDFTRNYIIPSSHILLHLIESVNVTTLLLTILSEVIECWQLKVMLIDFQQQIS